MSLGSGGGVVNCLTALQTRLLVLNGDSLCLGGLDELIKLGDEKR